MNTICDLKTALARMSEDLEKLARDKAPKYIAGTGEAHFRNNFRKGGFVNNGLHPWPKTRRQQSGRADKASQLGPLTSGRNFLMDSTIGESSDYRATIKNDHQFAAIHNFGGTTHPEVTPAMRAHGWKVFFDAIGKKKTGNFTAKKEKRTFRQARYSEAKIDQEALMWRRIALTTKTHLDVKIPQRQFIGESAELNDKIIGYIEQQTREILKKNGLL